MLFGILQGRLFSPGGGLLQVFRETFGVTSSPLLEPWVLTQLSGIYDPHRANVNPLRTDDDIAELKLVWGIPASD